MHDLIIIGAGPAGSSAATTAARGGAKVLLLEKARFPRHKVCGEFVSAESLQLLSTLLTSQHAKLLSEAIFLPHSRLFLDGRVLHAEVNPPAASIARLDLDSALWSSASDAGVEALDQTTVQSITWSSGNFEVQTSRGSFTSRAVIDASGRWSNLTAKNSTGFRREKWLGVKGHFTEESPSQTIDLYFFDGGYCGVSPVELDGAASGNRVNACAMVRADVASDLSTVFDLHPALRERARHWQPLMNQVTTSPLIFRNPSPLRGNILLAGDAATFVDPFIGDGISLALRSGACAATAFLGVLRESLSLEQVCQHYQSIYQKDFARVYRASSKLRRMLNVPRPVRKPFVFLLEKSPALSNYLVRVTR